jgi:YD repeat-containing protein
LSRHLGYATRFIADKKFTEAEQEIKAAEELDRDSPQILPVRAKLLNARNELTQALTLLDAYDERVVDSTERRVGEEVRVEVAYHLNKRKSEAKAELRRLYQEGRYREAQALAAASVELDRQDPEFLYYSGLLSAVLRKNPTAVEHLQAYLKASNSVATDPKLRELSFRVLSLLEMPQPAATSGAPNWFSGRKAAADVFYCPESLAFQPKVSVIRADKQEQTFEWTQNGRLSAITSTRTPGSYFFDYFENASQVARVGEGKADAGSKGVGIVLPSSPAVNPDVLALLERPATVGFAPNPYFNPFVWTGMHSFRFAYDKQGRVESAAEIGAPRLARFTWTGDRLQSISVYATDGAREQPVYKRSMSYSAGKLISETVDYGGKQYRIIYKYVGDKLSEAEFEDTGAHDGVERRVRFL